MFRLLRIRKGVSPGFRYFERNDLLRVAGQALNRTFARIFSTVQ